MTRFPCGVCGRVVTRPLISNAKRRVPHKCPHGVWCVTGHPLLGAHANQTPLMGRHRCDACAAVERARRKP